MFKRTPAYNSRRPHKYLLAWLKSTQPTVGRKSQVLYEHIWSFVRSVRIFDSMFSTHCVFALSLFAVLCGLKCMAAVAPVVAAIDHRHHFHRILFDMYLPFNYIEFT